MRVIRRIKRILMLAILVILAICAFNCFRGCSYGNVSSSTSKSIVTVYDEETGVTKDGKVYAEFNEKVDGDTAWFLVNGERLKVRFLGIDTPETVKEDTEVEAWGPEASNYTTNRLENANEIYLEYDPNSDSTDAYGRTLAWVWVDGSLLEKELIAQGYAEVAYIYGDYLYTDELYEAQRQAQNNGVGIWSTANDEFN